MVDAKQARAVVMRRYGPPEVLGFESVARAPLKNGEIRVRSLASAVNHSDLEIRAGNWPLMRDPPFPYVPGLEVAGEVTEIGPDVTELRPGDRAITMMQGLGGVRAERPGGYAEEVTISASAAAPIPEGVDPVDLALIGLAGVTAFEGLRRLGAINGCRVVVTGASGGVGSAAVGVARALGAEVIGLVSRPVRVEYVRSLGAVDVLTAQEVAKGALGERSVDRVLDTVAGELFAPCLAALRDGGALSLVGAAGGSQVTFDAYRLLEISLTGYSSESLDGPSLRRAIAAIAGWLNGGALVLPSRTVFPLSDAARAHEALEAHRIEGRVLLLPD